MVKAMMRVTLRLAVDTIIINDLITSRQTSPKLKVGIM